MTAQKSAEKNPKLSKLRRACLARLERAAGSEGDGETINLQKTWGEISFLFLWLASFWFTKGDFGYDSKAL